MSPGEKTLPLILRISALASFGLESVELLESSLSLVAVPLRRSGERGAETTG